MLAEPIAWDRDTFLMGIALDSISMDLFPIFFLLTSGPARPARPVRMAPVQTQVLAAIPARVVIPVQAARLAQAD